MAPRLNKRQLREQEELSALRPTENGSGIDDEETPFSVEGSTMFGTLVVEDLEEEQPSHQPSKLKKSYANRVRKGKKKKKQTVTDPATQNLPPPTVSKKSKKQKAKGQSSHNHDFDKVLAELSLDPYNGPQPVVPGGISNPGPSANKRFVALLSTSPQHLDGDLEMRKFFGSKIVVSSKITPRAASKRVNAAHRSTLTNPKPNWWPAQLREGLSIRQLTPNECEDKLFRYGWSVRPEEVWWTVEYGKKYRAITMAFMQTVMSGDPEGFNHLLRAQPYHADTLLQLAEVYSHREEYSTASDFIDRALFSYERAFVGAFNFMGGYHRLDFDRVENRPFYLAIHRQLVDLYRRGCTRTAFEFAKLLYSLDPWTDPHGSLLHLDGLAVKAGRHDWILDIWEYFETNRDYLEGRLTPTVLPGWWYTRALAMKIREDATITQAFVAAVLRFPSLLPLLADKVDTPLPAEVRSKPAFKLHVDSSSLSSPTDAVVQLLCHLYVQRWGDIWLGDSHSSWLSECIRSLPSLGSASTSTSEDRSTVLAATTIHTSIYRHVIILEKTCRTLFPFIPKEILNSRQLACDPLPPNLRVSEYNGEFFQGAENILGYRPRRLNPREEGRFLERLIPDGLFRRQLQDFFVAHPNFAVRFPGGVIQFAQLAAQLPEDALEDLMIAEANGIGMPNPNEGMPGQLQGEVGVLDFEPDVGDQNPGVGGPGDDSDDETNVEPLPVRILRNVVNRFLGRDAAEVSESSSSDEGGNLDQDGVD
ncbi:DUF654-domain-containing protein [Thelephora ganbajun]|uniref:DUF654-domain-containing protein n=1 Tax=Thelephora ganbajun TaxID=370292 RepID=A0ACB6ZNP0_THEGA|nr:DUF654-domain-containing protein [Thelephora ganbajun]